jgi:hypothetical protein
MVPSDARRPGRPHAVLAAFARAEPPTIPAALLAHVMLSKGMYNPILPWNCDLDLAMALSYHFDSPSHRTSEFLEFSELLVLAGNVSEIFPPKK